MDAHARIGVVGATGAVGTVTLELLGERGYENVRAFSSARSAGARLPFGDGELVVEEATHRTLAAGDVDLFLFSVGTSASRELVPIASAGGALCVDKSSAYRLADGYPLVVPEVNGDRALDALERDRIVANPNRSTKRQVSRAFESRRTSRSPAQGRSVWTTSRTRPPATTTS
jgi:aspartate-semialdehyde dehydrogenase